MKLNIHLECFTMRKHPQQKKKRDKFYFARDIGKRCENKQNHPVKIDSLFT